MVLWFRGKQKERRLQPALSVKTEVPVGSPMLVFEPTSSGPPCTGDPLMAKFILFYENSDSKPPGWLLAGILTLLGIVATILAAVYL